jgi:hypothetical protein
MSEQLDQFRPVCLRDPHDIGDRVDRDGMRVLSGHLAPAGVDEALNEPVSEPVQIFFIGLHPSVRQQSGQECAVIAVLLPIKANKMGAPRQLIAMDFKLLAYIIAFGLKRERWDRSDDRNDGGKRTILAAEDFRHLFVPGHHESALILLAHHGAFGADVMEIAPWIVNNLHVLKKIRLYIRHRHLRSEYKAIISRAPQVRRHPPEGRSR